MDTINFWNGNKSTARQGYEKELLDACLRASEPNGSYQLRVDNTDYPSAEDEGNIFTIGMDILVTVAGNLKFENKRKIVVNQPLAKGLLGYRLLIVRDEFPDQFKRIGNISELRRLSIGIPETWADADLFRSNQFPVVEKGTFDDLFRLLKEGAFDYTALGANEIESVFKEHVAPLAGMRIEPSMMLYYPFPLVFYVNPDNPDLAERVEAGLLTINHSGEFEILFTKHHGDIVERLDLRCRKVFSLRNPVLPEALRDFRPDLLE